jgi:hypothetical protein
MNEIKERFINAEGVDSFKRVSETHILDLYLGIDNMSRYTLFLIADIEPLRLFSSQLINVQVGMRRDKRWGVSFSLINREFEDVFCHFCEDIINSSQNLKTADEGSDFVCTRYEKWQKMLSRYKGGILSESAIKGLIGELYFLLNYLIPIYGEEEAVNSWIGPEKANQDFVLGERWYEVKATVAGAENIKISSIEQLDTESDGELVIVYLDKTSYADDSKITLNSIFIETLSTLSGELIKQKLTDILLNLGYYNRSEYDEHIFRFCKMERYKVDSTFPCIRRNLLSKAIINSKYEMSVSFISRYLEG